MKYSLTILFITIALFSYGQKAIFNSHFYQTKILITPTNLAQAHFKDKYEGPEEVKEAWYIGFKSGTKKEKGVVEIISLNLIKF